MTEGAKRVIVIVLDSVGVGEMPDAAEYGDKGSDTLGHIVEKFKGLDLPNLEKLGLGKIKNLHPGKEAPDAQGAYGRMAEVSASKDTTAGHWEIMGSPARRPFPTYPNGFPEDLLNTFKKAAGVGGILGNKASSGTVILEELGEEHVKTGFPIVYTSADSVFQIAAHEKYFGLDRLYSVCEKAREILTGPHAIARVIARPFNGEAGSFARTTNRKDYAIEPVSITLMDLAKAAGVNVVGVGKIGDIFAHRGLTEEQHTGLNGAGIKQTIEDIKRVPEKKELLFVNLVDFDSLFGHRRNTQGYCDALKEFDAALPEIRKSMLKNDMLILTADHGCDPTYIAHTDHTREFVPLIVSGSMVKAGTDLGTRETFADIGATAAEYLGVEGLKKGTSFLKEIL
ncbi:MAG: phosphopentomutase [Elusimicrobiota bacterium]|nr:phosphopentomutase [Elusimicrobiota bacterium]